VSHFILPVNNIEVKLCHDREHNDSFGIARAIVKCPDEVELATSQRFRMASSPSDPAVQLFFDQAVLFFGAVVQIAKQQAKLPCFGSLNTMLLTFLGS